MGFKDEIDLMNKTFDGTVQDEPEDLTDVLEVDDPPVDDPPIVPDEPVDDPEPKNPDEPQEDILDDPIEPEEPEEPDEPESEPEETLDEKDLIIKDLREKLAGKNKVEEPKPEEPVIEAPLTLEDTDFLKDIEDLDEFIRDPKELNKLLNSVRQNAIDKTREVLGEGILRSIPDIVKNNIMLVNNLSKMTEKFYDDNEDLVPFKKVVATVFEELSSENPDKKYDELMKDVAPEVRTRLALHKTATNKKKTESPTLPRKASKPGQTREKNKPSELSSQIGEMNKTLGGN